MRISFLRVVPIKSGMGGCNQHFRVCVGQFAGGGVSVVMPMVVTPVVLCGASGGLCMSLRIFALSCRLLFFLCDAGSKLYEGNETLPTRRMTFAGIPYRIAVPRLACVCPLARLHVKNINVWKKTAESFVD